MRLSYLTAHHIRKAAKLIKKKEGFLARIRLIEQELEVFIAEALPGKAAKKAKVPQKPRKMSAAGRAKIAAAQKARWAKVKKK